MTTDRTEVSVPASRLGRWVENFEARHGPALLEAADGALVGTAADGATFAARLPFDLPYDGAADPAEFQRAARPPERWGVLLVRKGGFAVALMRGEAMAEHKVGQRHVQGRTKAGGQSQQRFARRREQQARVAFEAAADHAARILTQVGGAELPVVVGGDRAAVREVLSDVRLAHLGETGTFLPVPDPRRRELDDAIAEAQRVRLTVENRD